MTLGTTNIKNQRKVNERNSIPLTNTKLQKKDLHFARKLKNKTGVNTDSLTHVKTPKQPQKISQLFSKYTCYRTHITLFL